MDNNYEKARLEAKKVGNGSPLFERFFMSGVKWIMENVVAPAEADSEAATSKLEEMEAVLADREATIKDLTLMLAEKETEIMALKEENAPKGETKAAPKKRAKKTTTAEANEALTEEAAAIIGEENA